MPQTAEKNFDLLQNQAGQGGKKCENHTMPDSQHSYIL